jgi:hypothetical protein
VTALLRQQQIITKQILDGRTGLAAGQPRIEVDDSLFVFRDPFPDEPSKREFSA